MYNYDMVHCQQVGVLVDKDAICIKAGLLKLWVMTHKWVPEPSHLGCENALCKNIITIMTSVSLAANKMRLLYDYFTSANKRFLQDKGNGCNK